MWLKAFISALHITSMLFFFMVIQIEVFGILSIGEVCVVKNTCGIDPLESLFVQIYCVLHFVLVFVCFSILVDKFQKIHLERITLSFALFGFWGSIAFPIMVQFTYYGDLEDEYLQYCLVNMRMLLLILIGVNFVSYMLPPLILDIDGVMYRSEAIEKKQAHAGEYDDVNLAIA